MTIPYRLPRHIVVVTLAAALGLLALSAAGAEAPTRQRGPAQHGRTATAQDQRRPRVSANRARGRAAAHDHRRHRIGEQRARRPKLPHPRQAAGGGVLVPPQLRQVPTLPEMEIDEERTDLSSSRGPQVATVGSNVRANDTAGDPGGNANSETSIAALGRHLVAAWNDGVSFASPGLTGYSYSSNGGATFTDGGIVPVPNGAAIHEGDPVVTADYAGNFYISDLYSPDNDVTSAIAVTRGGFTGASFAWNMPVVVASTTTDFLDKEWIAVDRDSGIVYVAWTRFLSGGGNRIEFTRSLDHGATWDPAQALTSESAEDVQGVRVAVGPNGEVQLVYIVFDHATSENYIQARRSTDHGVSFGPEVRLPTGPSGILSGYGSGPPGFNRSGGIGFPSLAIDNSLGPNRGRAYATWEETVNFYTDPLGALGSISESEANNSTATAHPFTIGQDVNGTLTTTTDQDWFSFTAVAGQTVILYLVPGDAPTADGFLRLFCGGGAAANRVALSYIDFGTGLIVYTPPSVGTYYVRVLAASSSSPLGNYVLHTGLDVPNPGDEVARDTRDVVIQSSDDGATWGARHLANDDPARFDDAFPEVAVDQAGQVYVDWYDHRGDGSCGILTDIYYARSGDGGASFLASAKVNDGASINWSTVGTNLIPNMGDYSALVAEGCVVYANFADGRQGSPDSWVAAITSGVQGPSATSIAADDQEVFEGTKVTLTATVAPHGAGGTVEFFDAAGSLGVAPVDSTGHASLSVADFIVGDHPLTGSYSGDSCLLASGSDTIVVAVGDPSLVAVSSGPALALGLSRIAPNPTSGALAVEYALPRDAEVRLSVLDLQGREIAVLAEGSRPAGRHQAMWGGRTARGDAAAGVYFVRFAAAGRVFAQRIVVAR